MKRQSQPWIVSDELWSLIEPLLPAPGPKLSPVGRGCRTGKPCAGSGILFVLHTGIQWKYLPQELGFGSGMTCWRRLEAWNEAGVWDQPHGVLLKKLRSADKLDWSRGDRLLPRQGRSAGPASGPSPSTVHVRAASTTSSPTPRASRSRCP
ncbi:hypothetical protein GCM10010423_70290 [Streptomyces levis]|uniref:Insertion element IS402-like domain-containing protein n=1 Tax=Streptomyces levis TaxID=285566 RepID=A0ABN3P569_9ACTN